MGKCQLDKYMNNDEVHVCILCIRDMFYFVDTASIRFKWTQTIAFWHCAYTLQLWYVLFLFIFILLQ